MRALMTSVSSSKTILKQLQQAILVDQIEELAAANHTCSHCTGNRSIHDYRLGTIDTLFGRLMVKLPRYRKCGCVDEADEHIKRSSSPLAGYYLIARRRNCKYFKPNWVRANQAGKRRGSLKLSCPVQNRAIQLCATDWASVAFNSRFQLKQ